MDGKFLRMKRGIEDSNINIQPKHKSLVFNEINKNVYQKQQFHDETLNYLNQEELNRLILINPIMILEKNTKLFISIIENNHILLEGIPSELIINCFLIACNYLKEMDKQLKLNGLKIIEILFNVINEQYFKNSYVFEKELIKNFGLATATSKTKKFVSLGDYEVSKLDSNIGINYGYFATVLDDEKKEIKIQTLNVIKIIARKYKTFAETSFKYIVEMINDEEDEVRFETILCLEDLISQFNILDAKTCEIIYFNLNEKSSKLRKMLYSLLSRIHFQYSKDYKDFIQTLLESLKAFDEDRSNIFECLKKSLNFNVKFIEVEYITEILNLDKNFLFPEFNWYDISYALKMIILQEFMKTNTQTITIPAFFIKHFIYFSKKFPRIYERDFVLKRLKPKTLISEDFTEETSINDFRLYPINDKLIKEKLSILETMLDTIKIEEIYSSSYFYLLYVINYQIEINLNNEEIFILISKIIMLTEMINLKLYDLNSSSSKELARINNFLVAKLLSKTFNNYKYPLIDNMSFIEDSLRKAENIQLLKKMNYEIPKEKLGYIEQQIRLSYKEEISNKLIFCQFINPKNFFQYCCSKDKKHFPYFIVVDIKIKNCSYTSSILFNFSLLLQKKDKQPIEIFVNPSDFEYNEKDKHYFLKMKLPLSIDMKEESVYDIFLVKKSNPLKLYNEFLMKIGFDLKIEKTKDNRFYIFAERNNFQIILENL